MATLTQNGLEFDRLEACLTKLQDIAKGKFTDLVPVGEELDVDDSSILGRVLGIVAELDALNEELLFDMYSAFDPDQAQGIFLDKLFRLRDAYRLPATPAVSLLTLRGQTGVTVLSGSSVGSTKTGDRFTTLSDVTFREDFGQGVVLDITSLTIGDVYSLSYKSAKGVNDYPPIGVSYVVGDTKKSIAKKFADTINAISSILDAAVDSEDMVQVKYKDRGVTGFFFPSISLSVVKSYQNAYSVAATFTAIKQAPMTLTNIQSPVLGWDEVYNSYSSVASVPEETDKDFRLRVKFKSGNDSSGSRQAMQSELEALEGVRFVNIQENIQDTEFEGRGAHGISVVVFGGDDDEIADVIARNRPCGCLTDGDIVIGVADINGKTQDIAFRRPVLVPIKVKLALTTDRSYPSDGNIRIQDAIVSHFDTLNVGDDVKLSRLYTPINTVDGQSVNSLQIGLLSGDYGTDNLELAFDELATISYENINI